MRANQDIRAAMTNNGVKFWECAEKMKISPSTLTVWMRHELPAEKKEIIFNAINEIAKGKEAERV